MNTNTVNVNKVIGAIEGGGTKFVCAIFDLSGRILDQTEFPTTSPIETLARTVDYFKRLESQFGELLALGVGMFGPITVNAESERYGEILPTPKKGWEGANIVVELERAFDGITIALDTDVNASAIGEGMKGAAQNLNSYVYITIGTGIGGGVVTNGKVVNGLVHPEIGHMSIHAHDSFSGVCPYHKNCAEGLASGTAINERWGEKAQNLPADHPAWRLEAKYLASLCQTLIAVMSPERIILGGGVMKQDHLLPMIVEEFESLVGGYWSVPNDYIVKPILGGEAALYGCFEMAMKGL